MGWLQSVRVARKDNSIYVSFYYNYDEDPYGDTVSINVYFRGALLIESEGKILAERLRYDRKEWDASGPRNFKDINTSKANGFRSHFGSYAFSYCICFNWTKLFRVSSFLNKSLDDAHILCYLFFRNSNSKFVNPSGNSKQI